MVLQNFVRHSATLGIPIGPLAIKLNRAFIDRDPPHLPDLLGPQQGIRNQRLWAVIND